MEYEITITVKEKNGGYIDRKYYYKNGEDISDDFREKIEDMIDTLEKSHEVKF